MMDWMSLLSRGRQPVQYGGPQGGGMMGAIHGLGLPQQPGGGMAGMLPQAQPQAQPQGAFGMLGNMVAQPRPMGGPVSGGGRGGSQMLGLLRRA